MTYIKQIATYMLDLATTFLGFASYAEASALVLGEDLDIICIWTEAAYARLVQDKDTDREHRIVLRAIRNAVELDQKRSEKYTVTILQIYLSKIDSFTKKMESSVWASISLIK